MVSDDSGMFINTAKLNLEKYAARPALAKALFMVRECRLAKCIFPFLFIVLLPLTVHPARGQRCCPGTGAGGTGHTAVQFRGHLVEK